MTIAERASKPAWQAEVKWRRRCYTTEELVRKGDIEETAEGELVEATEDKVLEVLHRVTELFVHVSDRAVSRFASSSMPATAGTSPSPTCAAATRGPPARPASGARCRRRGSTSLAR